VAPAVLPFVVGILAAAVALGRGGLRSPSFDTWYQPETVRN